MDAFLAALPKLLFCSLSALPIALGLFIAVHHLSAGARPAYLKHLTASLTAGAVALALLWSSLFGDSLSKSSTAALIFAVAPFYAGAAYGLVYGIAALIFRKAAPLQPIPSLARAALLLPMLVLAVLMAGLVKTSAQDNETTIAERSANPATLRRLLAQAQSGELDKFAIALHLAQNPDAPADVLATLARFEHAAVRAHVAHNPATPPAVVASLRDDCASFVRKAVVARLGPDTAAGATSMPTGECALARWR